MLIFRNLAVTVIKFGAYFLSGSASMLSEAIHSLADGTNQVREGNFLLKDLYFIYPTKIRFCCIVHMLIIHRSCWVLVSGSLLNSRLLIIRKNLL